MTSLDVDALKEFVAKNDMNKLKSLLRDKNHKLHMNTAFQLAFVAAKLGHLDIVLYFAEKYPEVLTRTNGSGETILHGTVNANVLNVKTLRMFVEEKGVPLMATDYYGKTIAHLAAEKGYLDIVKYVVEQDPSVMSLVIKDFISQQNIAHLAAKNGQWDVLWYIVKKDLSLLKKKDGEGNTPLHLAVQKNGVSVEKLRSLVKQKGVKLDEENNYGETIAHFAASSGNLPIIFYIANKEPSMLQKKTKHYRSKTVAISASKNGHWDITWFLAACNPSVYTEVVEKSGSIFYSAVEKNLINLEKLKFLLEEKKIPLNLTETVEKFTLAHLAIKNGNLEVFHYLVEKKPSLLSGTTAHLAFQKGYLKDIISCLVEKAPSVFAQQVEDNTVLHMAIEQNLITTETLERLLNEKHITEILINSKGDTLAHAAAKDSRNSSLLEYLARKNASLLAWKNIDGNTVAHVAAKRGHVDILRVISETNPSVIVKTDRQKNNVLHLLAAARILFVNDLKNLVQRGVSLMETNLQGETVAHIAARNGLVEVVEYVKQKEPTVLKKKNKAGRTIAFTAAENARYDVIKCIVDKDVWLDKDNSGNTIFHLLIESGNFDLYSLEIPKVPLDTFLKPNSTGWSVVYLAAQTAAHEIIERIAEEKPSILIEKNSHGDNVLLHAARYHQFSIAKLIMSKNLEHQAENIHALFEFLEKENVFNIIKYMEQRSNEVPGWNQKLFEGIATHNAIEFGYWTILKHFTEAKKVDVNVPNPMGEPPIFIAVRCKHYDMLKYLVEQKGADLLKTDDQKNNVLFVAAEGDDLSTIKYILDDRKAPIDIDWQNKIGDTILHIAMQRTLSLSQWRESESSSQTEESESEDDCVPATVKYLIEKKHANVNILGKGNTSVFLCATAHQRYDVCNYLLNHGANPHIKDNTGKDFWAISRFNVRHRRDILSPMGEESISMFKSLTQPRVEEYLRSVANHVTAEKGSVFAYSTHYQLSLPGFFMLALSSLQNRKNLMRQFSPPQYSSPTEMLHAKIDPVALNAVHTNQ